MKPLRKYIWRTSLVCLIFLAACGGSKEPAATPLDQAAIFTAAAETVVAQMTTTAMAVSPTPSVTPTATPSVPPSTLPPGITPLVPGTPALPGTPGLVLPTSTSIATAGNSPGTGGCDNYVWIADIGVQDNDVMKPGQDFVKTWRIQNTGTCGWDEGYVLKYLGGSLDGYDFKLKKSKDFVAPGETKDISVNLTAPLIPNTYTDCWKWQNDKGYFFGPYPLCATIIVEK
jgi:hypothetical protein